MATVIRGSDNFDSALAIVEDANGNVGIGVTPESWSSNNPALQIGSGGVLYSHVSNGTRVSLQGNAYVNSSNADAYITTNEASQHLQEDGNHLFKVAPSGTADAAISWTTAMTINNAGNVLVGTTSTPQSGTAGVELGASFVRIGKSSTSVGTQMQFSNPNGVVGSVVTNGSATAYNTSSDYRLKENVTPMSGATAQTKLLKPCNFDWITGGNVNGFLAHELADVVPEAVTGTKDAMRDEEYEVTAAVLDAEGNETTAAVMGTRSVPDLQGIDQSKLVPLLTATIQELITRIEALEGI